MPHLMQERWKEIQRQVVEPRQLERHKIQTGQWAYPYQYDKVRAWGGVCTALQGGTEGGCKAGEGCRGRAEQLHPATHAVLADSHPLRQRCPPADRHALPVRHICEQEAFHVRRKDFWPLTKSRRLIHDFIPQLCHEADGLIFQGAQVGRSAVFQYGRGGLGVVGIGVLGGGVRDLTAHAVQHCVSLCLAPPCTKPALTPPSVCFLNGPPTACPCRTLTSPAPARSCSSGSLRT